jgi:hypothetical protein
MDADTPMVSIDPRRSNRNFLRLPTLQIVFRINARCIDDRKPVSIQLSVADTRKTLHADKIEVNATTEISLSIPANQIAPVAIREFCKLPESPQDVGNRHRQLNDRITIPAALSAQASLRCASESGEQTIYVSTPLDVTLICKLEAESISLR